MFDAIITVQIQFRQVKSVLAVTLVQHVCGKVWDKEAEGWREIGCGSNSFIKFLERYIPTVTRENAWVQCE